MKNQKKLNDFVRDQKPNRALKPPKLNNLISKESPMSRGPIIPQYSETSTVLPSTNVDIDSNTQVRSTYDKL
jgi:hypothetical protein